jgi:hypothetical protein
MKPGKRLPGRATPGTGQRANFALSPQRGLHKRIHRGRSGSDVGEFGLATRQNGRRPGTPQCRLRRDLSRTSQQHPVVEHRVDCRSGSGDPVDDAGQAE